VSVQDFFVHRSVVPGCSLCVSTTENRLKRALCRGQDLNVVYILSDRFLRPSCCREGKLAVH
jgi:hypothetical protein